MNKLTEKAKLFNQTMKVENSRTNIKSAKTLLGMLSAEDPFEFNHMNLVKYMEKHPEIIIKNWTSKAGNLTYLLKDGNREMTIIEKDLQYAVINTKTHVIYRNVGIEALKY